MTVDAERVEAEVRALCERGAYANAATRALQAYGGEVMGYLVAVHRDEDIAGDVFSAFAEGVWRGLPRFAWASSLRTWLYAVARNVSRTARRDAARRERRVAPATESALAAIAERIRTETLSYLRTEKRTRVEALRDALSPEDRALLVLRVDRGMAWTDLALILGDDGGSAAALAKESARLRTRFQRLKARLRELARASGLRE